MRLPVVTILAGLLLLHLAAAQDEPEAESALEKARAEAVRVTIGELEALADFCVENKLLLGRDLCFEALIRFDPDHRRARKVLKYVQRRDGTWEQKPYRRPTNKNVELEPEFYERHDGILSKLIKDLHAALVEAGKEEKPEVRELVIDAILAADPDDVEAHRLRGEVSYDGRWVLEETASAKERLPELRRFAKRAIDEVDAPKPISPDATEESLGLTWTASFQGEWWRGLGTVNAHEVERAVRVMDASLPFFNHALGVEMYRPRNCGFYLLRGKDDAALALRKHPSIDQSQVNYFLTLRAAWVPGKHFFFQWSDNATVRLDGSVRMALGILLMKKFNIDIRRGWVWEGAGLYLDYLLTGSHRTVFVTRRRTTAKRRSPFDIETRMKEPGANWMLLARRLLDKDLAPDLEIMCGKSVNDLEPEQLVFGYALCAYLIEGRPEKVARFLHTHGVDQPIRETVPMVFGIPLPKFVERFHRWLREVT